MKLYDLNEPINEEERKKRNDKRKVIEIIMNSRNINYPILKLKMGSQSDSAINDMFENSFKFFRETQVQYRKVI